MDKRNNEIKLEGEEHKQSKEMDKLIEFAEDTVRKSLHIISAKATDLNVSVVDATPRLVRIYLAMAMAMKETREIWDKSGGKF